MKVRAVRWNSGVMFDVVTADGKPSQRATKAGKAALTVACDRYKDEVEAAFKAAGIADIGYAEDFRRARPESTPLKLGLFLRLEPWGFASGTLEAPVMADTGSCPTDTRARVLLCYQAPFSRTMNRDDTVTLSKVYEVEP